MVTFLCLALGAWSPETPIMLRRRPFSKLAPEPELEVELDREPEFGL